MEEQRPVYHLTLRPLKDSIPAIVRLRSLLKIALRTFRLECLEAREGDPPTDPPTPSPAASGPPEAAPGPAEGPERGSNAP
jgi:hypothetical protein